MQEYVFLDGNYIEKDKASLPIMTHAFLYGTSVFEGIRAYYNKEENQLYAFKVKEHYERLMKSAHVMHMENPYTLDEYCELTKKLLIKNNYKEDVYIRPNLFKAAQKIGPSLLNNKDSFLLFTLPMGDYIDIEKGLNVCVSSWRRNSDNAIPPRSKVAGAYVNTALIKSDAQLAGFDDAIVLDENGKVTEGSAMNLFLVQNGKLITSRTTDNILIGVTRNTVMQLAKEVLKLDVEEREVSRTELYTSDEAFYCGTGAQISPIVAIDHRKLGNGDVGPISKDLQKLYFDVVKGRVDKYKEWCMPVYD